MKRQRGSIALGVMIALALSLFANLWLWKAKTVEHDARTTAEAKLEAANGATKACNDSIASIEEDARAQVKKAEKARVAARNRANALAARADRELATPATVPGDDCRSAQERVRRILTERGKP